MPRLTGLFAAVCTLFVSANLTLAQTGGPPPERPKDSNVIRVGVAEPQNLSRRMINVPWEQTQLLTTLKDLSNKKKDPRKYEIVKLESRTRNDAMEECAEKKCDFVVTTTFVDPDREPMISPGPGGVGVNPPVFGNADPRTRVTVDFALLVPGRLRPVADGRSVAPEGMNEQDAPDEAIRQTASRIASELRKKRPPMTE
jgi:hypothetical protein